MFSSTIGTSDLDSTKDRKSVDRRGSITSQHLGRSRSGPGSSRRNSVAHQRLSTRLSMQNSSLRDSKETIYEDNNNGSEPRNSQAVYDRNSYRLRTQFLLFVYFETYFIF